MYKQRYLKMLILSLFLMANLPVISCKKNEHPAEHPKETAVKEQITKDELADAIETYVDKEASENDSYFIAFDDKTGKELKLTLDKVHRKRLSRIGEDNYFACADFKTQEGKVYDLDVFMTGQDKDSLTFSKFMVHKEAGKERYTWYEEDGVWKTRSFGKTIEEHPNDKEHPDEHPNKKSSKEEHPSEHPK